MTKTLLTIACLALTASLSGIQPAGALDPLTMASGSPGDWDTGTADFGMRRNSFKNNGIDLKIVYTEGGGATLQAVNSGSADIGVAVSPAAVLGAATKGAPVKIISQQYKGALDTIWYVRADSPIRSLKDITPKTTVSFSTNGSSSNMLAMAMLRQIGVDAVLVATGDGTATLTQVMSGQIDVGYNVDGGLGFLAEGAKVRVIGSANDVDEARDVTARVFIANANTLSTRRDAIVRFLRVYQETQDWMYKDPLALQWYAENKRVSLADATRVRDLIYPEKALTLGPVIGGQAIVRTAVDSKRINAPITPEQFAQYVDILWPPQK